MKKLETEIAAYNTKNTLRFHVPAHKGRLQDKFLNSAYDITELDFSDNLNNPTGVIADEEAHISDIFGSKCSLISVNGASSAIFTAIACALKRDETIIIGDDAHISAYYGCIHCGAKVFRAKISDHIAGLSLNDLKSAYEQAESVAVKPTACFITYPTYFGCAQDIIAICEYAQEKNMRVIVDEAHGTHFLFGKEYAYPTSAIEAKADYVIHSGHKSINALTQTGILHVCTDHSDAKRAKEKMRSFTSTSPSYLLMLSLIRAVEEINNDRTKLNDIAKWYNTIEESFGENRILLNKAKASACACMGYDPFKLCIYAPDLNAKSLSEDYAVYPELSRNGLTLFACGMNTNINDIHRLNAILHKQTNPSKYDISNIFYSFPSHEAKLIDICTAYESEGQYLPTTKCVGLKSADFVYCYPPGAPILIPGETITESSVEFLIMHPDFKGSESNSLKVF